MSSKIIPISNETITTNKLLYAYDSDISYKNIISNVAGMDIRLYSALESALDVSINKHTAFVLTDMKNLGDMLELSRPNPDKKPIHKTELRIYDGKLIVNDQYTDTPTLGLASVLDKSDDLNKFNIEFVDDIYCYIYNYRNDGTKLYIDADNASITRTPSLFRYSIQSADTRTNISFYKVLDGIKMLSVAPNNLGVYIPTIKVITDVSFDINSEINEDSIFSITNIPDTGEMYIGDTFTTYSKNVVDESLKKDRVININNNSLIDINYSTTNEEKDMFTNILSLKNTITYMNQQGIDSIVPGLDETQHRFYRTIYSGNNTDSGAYNIELSFDNFIKSYNLTAGKITYFNLPQTMGDYTRININSIHLQEQGAIPGDSPVRSDKIFKKLISRPDTTNSGRPSGDMNGTFLCSWLKYNGEGRPVWMDRYYFPNKIGENDALFATPVITSVNKIYDAIKQSIISEVYDVPSNLTFEPGCNYAYHHIGEADIDMFISDINKGKVTNDISSENIVPVVDSYITTTKQPKNVSFSLSIERDYWPQSFCHQLFGDLTNTGIGIYNQTNITPFIYDYVNTGPNSVVRCTDSYGVLLHSTHIYTPILKMVVGGYMEDIVMIHPSGAYDCNTTLNPISITSNYVCAVYTNDLKLKYTFLVPTQNISVNQNILYVHTGMDSFVHKINLDNIATPVETVSATVISIPNNTKASINNITAIGGVVYMHPFRKLIPYINSTMLGLYETNSVYKISTDDVNYIQKQLVSAELINKIYDINTDGDLCLVLFDAGSYAEPKRTIALFDPSMYERYDRIDISADSNCQKFLISKEFGYDENTSSILVRGTNGNVLKYAYNGNKISRGSVYILGNMDNGYIISSANNTGPDTLFVVKIALKNKYSNTKTTKSVYIPRPKEIVGVQTICGSIDAGSGIFSVFFNGELIQTIRFDAAQYDLDMSVGPRFMVGKSTYFNNITLEKYLYYDGAFITPETRFKHAAVYDYPLNIIDAKILHAKYNTIPDMTINLPINKTSMFDKIERFFKMKGVPYKTTKFDIIINNTEAIPKSIRDEVEANIYENLKDIIPAQTNLNEIKWQ